MKCIVCGEESQNKKYCSNLCCNKDRSLKGTEKLYGLKKEYRVSCFKCEKEFSVFEYEKSFPKKEKYYCSRSCANSRIFSDESKELKRNKNLIFHYGNDYENITINIKKRTNELKTVSGICECCKSIFILKKKNQMFCCRICANKTLDHSKNGKKGGLKSVVSQNRRSKNEIYFSELCQKEFKNVLLNEQMFNGWDADVILPNYKLAILWNGNWHHKKLSQKHSVEQVQNRDKIKIKEIIKLGYTPYIINDYGRYDMKLVETEFIKLKEKIFSKNI